MEFYSGKKVWKSREEKEMRLFCINTFYSKRQIGTVLFQSGAFVFFVPFSGQFRTDFYDYLWDNLYIGM